MASCTNIKHVITYYSVAISASTMLLLFQLEPLVNGPFTPDLANPISQLGKNAQEKGWPMDIKVGTAKFSQLVVVHLYIASSPGPL